MLCDCTLSEHFEYRIDFNEHFILSVWNIYTPPNKIQYFFYKKKIIKSKIHIYGIYGSFFYI